MKATADNLRLHPGEQTQGDKVRHTDRHHVRPHVAGRLVPVDKPTWGRRMVGLVVLVDAVLVTAIVAKNSSSVLQGLKKH